MSLYCRVCLKFQKFMFKIVQWLSVADPENFGGGGFEAKTSKIRMSSPKLRLIFRPKSEIQTFFSPKIRWSPKKKKKRSSPKLRLIFRPKSEIQTLRLIFRPKSEIQTFFSPKIRWSPKKKKRKKEKVFTKIETDFSAGFVTFRSVGGCIPKWSRIIHNKG